MTPIIDVSICSVSHTSLMTHVQQQHDKVSLLVRIVVVHCFSMSRFRFSALKMLIIQVNTEVSQSFPTRNYKNVKESMETRKNAVEEARSARGLNISTVQKLRKKWCRKVDSGETDFSMLRS